MLAHASFPKQFHRHLPVGVKANRNDPKYPPSCPACDEPYETDEHFLLCKAPTRIAWRTKFLAALERELLRPHTVDSMIQFLKTALDRILSGRIVTSTGPFSIIATSQTRIGWMALLHGYWSFEWPCKAKYVKTQPMKATIRHSLLFEKRCSGRFEIERVRGNALLGCYWDAFRLVVDASNY
jgi:hypothetical protein